MRRLIMKDNFFLTLALIPGLIGIYFSFSNIKISAFCFALYAFAVFCYLLNKQSCSFSKQTQLLKDSFKSHYLAAITGIFATGATLLVAQTAISAIFCVVSFMAFAHLSWTLVKNKVELNYLQFILATFKKNLLLIIITLLTLFATGVAIIDIKVYGASSQSSLLLTLSLIFTFLNVEFNKALKSK